jgi:hypothetical protein
VGHPLWRVIHHYVETARHRADHSAVTSVAVDEAKARGYRSIRNLKAIIYLIAGKLELALPT